MNAIGTMLKAADALNSTRRNLMGLAEFCSAMDTMTEEDVWATLYSFVTHCAEQTQEPAEELTQLIAEMQGTKVEHPQPIFEPSITL